VADTVTIAAGQSVSTAVALARPELGLVIVFPASCAATDYRLQCAVSSGGAFGDWAVNLQPTLTPFTVLSAGAAGMPLFVAIAQPVPTPWVQLRGLVPQTLTSTFTLLPYGGPL
jgi:hypothetical protein